MLNIVRKCTVKCIWSYFWPTLKIFQAASRVKNRAVSSTMPTATSSNFVRTLRNSFRRRKKPDVRIIPHHISATPVPHQYHTSTLWYNSERLLRTRRYYPPSVHKIRPGGSLLKSYHRAELVIINLETGLGKWLTWKHNYQLEN